MFQIAYMITAPLVGKTLAKVGRKNMIILGYILTIAATTAFGVCYHIPKEINEDKTKNPNGKG